MLNKDQNQLAVDGSTAIQAGGNVTITQTGLGYSEVRDVALDVIRSHLNELAGAAKSIAMSRATEITEAFLKKLLTENASGLGKAEDPDFQHALFTVQKEYARCGDRELGDLLVDLLVDRSKRDQRDILQIVLNESLLTAPKLTESHLASLAVIFLFRYTQNRAIGNHDMLGEYLDRFALPFATKAAKHAAAYQHLAFTRCGNVEFGSLELENIIASTYQGLFLTGFDESELDNHALSEGRDERFFTSCLNDPKKLQVRAINKDALTQHLTNESISSDNQERIIALFDTGKMSPEEVKNKTISIRPFMADVFSMWNSSPMCSFMLTSVGMAIGHANIKRLAGEFADLKSWIN